MLFSTVMALLAVNVDAASMVPNLASSTAAEAYCSSSDSIYRLSRFDSPVQGTGASNGMSMWQLSVDDTPSGYKQKITGFGAAVTDATVTVFNKLSHGERNALLKQLMTSAGVNFSLLRHTIASSDLSGDPAYTYDDNGGKTDISLSSFNLGDRGNAMAVMLKAMKALNPGLIILGSSWSAPGWMKLNRALTGTTVNNNLNPTYASQFAQYFVKYLQAYERVGAHVDAITIQNEPLNSNAGFPTMYIFANESANLIKRNIGPALRNAGLSTQIWAYDHNTGILATRLDKEYKNANKALDQPDYPNIVINTAPSYVQAVAWHCYANNNNWGVLSDFHNKHPNVAQYMTECWTSKTTSWSQAADFTLGPLQNWANGALAWVLGSDTNYGPHLSGSGSCPTCRGLVVVDTNAGTYRFAIDYYMIGQFSRFIPKGARILAGTGSWSYSDDTGLQSVASLNPDGSKTVVILNKFSNDIYVTVTFKSGAKWSGRVYKKSVVTWILPG